MKKIFFKKILVSLVLIAVLGVISAGCGGSSSATAPTAPPTTPTTPTTCTVVVTSQDGTVWGQAVYMDGTQQPSTILAPWGSVQINNVTVGIRHAFYIIQGATLSHTIYLTTVPGTNYVDFYWF